MFQSSADRIVAFRATLNDLFHLCRLTDELSQFAKTIGAADQNNFVDAIGELECSDGVRDNRFSADQREHFVETHSLAASGGDDDRT